jgi:hypothetical protein
MVRLSRRKVPVFDEKNLGTVRAHAQGIQNRLQNIAKRMQSVAGRGPRGRFKIRTVSSFLRTNQEEFARFYPRMRVHVQAYACALLSSSRE